MTIPPAPASTDAPADTPVPLLSVVIVNWNVRELLHACLRSVERWVSVPHEVIVVDNASADDSVAMVRAAFPGVRLIASPDNLGFVGGCERGDADSAGALVLLLNPDTELHDDAVDRMTARFAHDPGLGIVGARLLNGDGSFQRATGGAFPTLRNLLWNYLFLNRLLPRRLAPPALYLDHAPAGLRPIDWVSGAALMFRRAAVGRPIFDPAIFMFGEDMELCDRVARAGWRVRVDGDAAITHHHGQSLRQQNAADVLASVYKGPRLFFRRHRGRAAAAAYDAILFLGYLLRWPGFTVAHRLRPDRGYDELAVFSRRYLGVMARDIGKRR